MHPVRVAGMVPKIEGNFRILKNTNVSLKDLKRVVFSHRILQADVGTGRYRRSGAQYRSRTCIPELRPTALTPVVAVLTLGLKDSTRLHIASDSVRPELLKQYRVM